MINETRVLFQYIPLKEQGRFKAHLAGQSSLDVVIKTNTPWEFDKSWDIVSFPKVTSKHTNKYWVTTDNKDFLSNNMYCYGDIIIFLENKGIHGEYHTKATVLTKNMGKSLWYPQGGL